MTRTSLEQFNCSLARTADIIGDKWTLLILRDAYFGASTFSQFHKSLGVARNILSDRLEKLVAHKVLDKQQTRPGVERYTYHLSPRGRALAPVLIAMTQWGDQWIFGQGAEPLQFLDREQGKPIRPVSIQASDGKVLGADDIRPAPGPAADRRIRKAFGADTSEDPSQRKST